MLNGTDAKEHSRKIIKTMFKRYNMLSISDSDNQAKAFQALIDACEGMLDDPTLHTYSTLCKIPILCVYLFSVCLSVCMPSNNASPFIS